MWKAIRRWWRVWRGKECWKCGSDNLYHADGSSPGIYTVTCEDCGMFIVKGY
jgi:hypothetical protein